MTKLSLLKKIIKHVSFYFLWNSSNTCWSRVMVEACWARASGWTPFALFEWHARLQNRTESHLTRRLLMHLATPRIVAELMWREGPRKSSETGFFPASFALSPPRKNHVVHCKITRFRHDPNPKTKMGQALDLP